jgi:hypothetical protein
MRDGSFGEPANFRGRCPPGATPREPTSADLQRYAMARQRELDDQNAAIVKAAREAPGGGDDFVIVHPSA